MLVNNWRPVELQKGLFKWSNGSGQKAINSRQLLEKAVEAQVIDSLDSE